MTKLLLFVLALASTGVQANEKVIYGDDNRVDPYESTNSVFVELAKSTAAMIPHSSISKINSDESRISGPTLAQRGMCQSERFANQLTAANCSGFLVTENYLVTAGHCITSTSDCNAYSWVFDYKAESQDQRTLNVASASVYKCKRIVARKLESWSQDDWALIELDRSVTDRRPLSFRKQDSVQVGEKMVVIGHPSGLPTKIADGAVVRTRKGSHFVSNLDTYGGNSGSAVINADTGVVEGILVRGATDYVYDSRQGCRASNVLGNQDGRGEDVTYITNIPQLRDL